MILQFLFSLYVSVGWYRLQGYYIIVSINIHVQNIETCREKNLLIEFLNDTLEVKYFQVERLETKFKIFPFFQYKCA